MKRTGVALAVLGLTACSQPAPAPSAPAKQAAIPAATGCNAQTSHDWSAVGGQYYMVEAEAHGPTCSEAVITIRIKGRDGALLFEHSYPVAEVSLAFNASDDQTGLRSDLEEWTQNAADTPAASWLPDWPPGSDHPPFFRPAVSRAQYESLRGVEGPLFCYADGAESQACVAMSGDQATLLGSRTPERE
jgi:hypothetical protein